LMEEGAWGRLRSCEPPITVPAWQSMATSRNPGRLGLYGFRNRSGYGYDEMATADGGAIREPQVWRHLSRARRKVIVLGVPQTYPPTPVNGALVSCFLTPGPEAEYTYPPELKTELLREGGYVIDVKDFRSDSKDALLAQLYAMTDNHFRLARHLTRTRPWDFFMMVDMSVDRLHHGFWRFMDRGHRLHESGNPHEHAIRDFYMHTDRLVGELIASFPPDTATIVVSDHGAQRMVGGVCVNDWLVANGWLALKEKPAKPGPLRTKDIDWTRTRAWASGGYYARVFLNVAGREPQGIVPKGDYERVRAELAAALEAIPDEKGAPIGTKAHRPEDLYPEVRGIAPDLIVYFGDLTWRSIGSVGMDALHVFENDTGPDDANHAPYGVFLAKVPGSPARGELSGLQLMDIAPTVLDLLGEPVPPEMEGRVIAC
ncbi:MAG: alkaline phosphatase family protein, partial [Candidatus Methylomirabilis sp.]|nr:alkaline phosphatase family protein [Deltaproteobacteria bacterium]